MILEINSKKINIKKANTFFKRFLGFMGKSNFNYGIIFPKTNSIHTFFMKEKIDVIGINRNLEIISIARSLDKNKIFTIKNKKKNTSIIELPNNASKGLKIGDKITLYK